MKNDFIFIEEKNNKKRNFIKKLYDELIKIH